jgi:ABC-type transport system involved in cytochrome bd biosynthesis fused ATPase/permease subunit
MDCKGIVFPARVGSGLSRRRGAPGVKMVRSFVLRNTCSVESKKMSARWWNHIANSDMVRPTRRKTQDQLEARTNETLISLKEQEDSGPSGCGKTTLMNLLLGLLIPERGEVLVNGRNLRTISSFDYAKLIGVVMQDDILFHGTVAENISFFEAPLDMNRVHRSAEMANIARDIDAMPMQYYSLLAEAAANISGGQKQRLFIARAVYHGPKILFLDEATSHLDSESERLVSQAVKSMLLTRILVAHRRETIATADRVISLDQTGSLAPQLEMS